MAANKHQIIAGSRNPDSEDGSSNITHTHYNLSWEVNEMVEVIGADIDVVFFVSGSRGKNLLQVDLHGAIKTMQASGKQV